MAELLRIEGISKRFGSFWANQDVSLSIQEGEVHTLLGENGAGKSTLMNVLMGLYKPTQGEIYVRGKHVRIASPKDAVDLGIGMVHQHFMLVDAMTALENIILGERGGSPVIQRADALAKVRELIERYGLDVDLTVPVSDLSIGARQRVEILKVLYRGADLLILDEPTAVLTDLEVEGLFQIIESLTSENKSVIFISHKMREVMRVSDKITVLRAGRSVKTVECRQVTEAELASLMIGRDFHEGSYAKVDAAAAGAPVALRFDHVDVEANVKRGGLKDVSLEVRAGEILGIAGVGGNGQAQLAQVACGLMAPDGGTVELLGKKVEHFDPLSFIIAGVSDIPEDRNKMGLIGDMSIAENLVLKSTDDERFAACGGACLRLDEIERFAVEQRESNDIRCTSIRQRVGDLSGGNQQKVIVARELGADPKVLVAVHPTRGLDIGATSFVHESMIAAREAGCAILMISADFDEVLKMSDRIAVMFEGRVMGVYPGKNAPIERISLAMAGKGDNDE
ncbi:ABC transporter ATP-binding protein [Collinsella sp. UBA1693]|uniref:ABC transporter ATP-binding protein n=1 Tax=Collinsella sp. UBA1693 TaxID=1946385 RepID=UPI00257FD450|nr:ABC transporter ATP-binding protein [Collinsella sp. UBA1693]